MRAKTLWLSLLALSGAVTLAACSGADDPPRVTSGLECEAPGGEVSSCVLTLPEPGGFTITLVSSSCDALNNEVRLTSPVEATLTSDACRAAPGTVWDYTSTVYPAGTEISLEVDSDKFAGQPGLRVTGAYPTWTVNFEDGYDTDFNDLVLQVHAVPAS